jgi:hypothetical protein
MRGIANQPNLLDVALAWCMTRLLDDACGLRPYILLEYRATRRAGGTARRVRHVVARARPCVGERQAGRPVATGHVATSTAFAFGSSPGDACLSRRGTRRVSSFADDQGLSAFVVVVVV